MEKPKPHGLWHGASAELEVARKASASGGLSLGTGVATAPVVRAVEAVPEPGPSPGEAKTAGGVR